MNKKIKALITIVAILSIPVLAIYGAYSLLHTRAKPYAPTPSVQYSHITLYSGGVVVREWTVQRDLIIRGTGSAYFVDKDSTPIAITGEFVIEDLRSVEVGAAR